MTPPRKPHQNNPERRAQGAPVVMSVRLPPWLIDMFDDMATAKGLNRTTAVRSAMTAWMKPTPTPKSTTTMSTQPDWTTINIANGITFGLDRGVLTKVFFEADALDTDADGNQDVDADTAGWALAEAGRRGYAAHYFKAWEGPFNGQVIGIVG